MTHDSTLHIFFNEVPTTQIPLKPYGGWSENVHWMRVLVKKCLLWHGLDKKEKRKKLSLTVRNRIVLDILKSSPLEWVKNVWQNRSAIRYIHVECSMWIASDSISVISLYVSSNKQNRSEQEFFFDRKTWALHAFVYNLSLASMHYISFNRSLIFCTRKLV